ncbi:hypothetical protein KY285_020183 [Solanum tuberosum]|nr:hypothetical protein KY285_020183 [Solanum tuberosum]
MTPTLEDIARFMGKESNIWGADLRNKRPIIPKNIDANRFTPNRCNYVSSHKEREAKIDFPKGILACEEKLSVSNPMPHVGLCINWQELKRSGSGVSFLSKVEQDKGKVVLGYLSWFRDPVTFGDTLEGSSRKRKTSTPYESWKKSWRRPKPPYPDKKFKARRQVHRLAEQTSYVIKNHRFMNDTKVPEQARAIVSHLPKVLLNPYETLGGQRKPQED